MSQQLLIGKLNRIKDNVVYMQVPCSMSPTERGTFEYMLHFKFINPTSVDNVKTFKPGDFIKIIYDDNHNTYPIRCINKIIKRQYHPFRKIKLTYKEL